MIVPNFVDVKVVNEDGTFTDEWRNIMQTLLQSAQLNLGNEGYVVPTVSSDPNSVTPPTSGGQLLQVQNNIITVNGVSSYTCKFGTIIYDSFDNKGKIALNNGAGAPIFKDITTS